MLKLIALAGKKQAGKDLSADYLINNHGYRRVSFADALKKFTSESFGIPLNYFHDNDLKEKQFLHPIVLYYSEIVILLDDLNEFDGQPQRLGWSNFPLEATLNNPRELLQFVGTDLGRNCVNKEIWVKPVIEHLKASTDKVVMTDCRLPNERTLLKDNFGAHLVLLKRNNESVDTHESENSLGLESEYDTVITNNREKEFLYERLNEIVEVISEQR
jgi:hypothetical protein